MGVVSGIMDYAADLLQGSLQSQASSPSSWTLACIGEDRLIMEEQVMFLESLILEKPILRLYLTRRHVVLDACEVVNPSSLVFLTTVQIYLNAGPKYLSNFLQSHP